MPSSKNGLASIQTIARSLQVLISKSQKAVLERATEVIFASSPIKLIDMFYQLLINANIRTATTQKETLIRILPTRGLSSLDQIRPRDHQGITVTDSTKSMLTRGTSTVLAHLYRDFKKFAERDGPDGEFGKRALFEMDEIFRAIREKCRKTMQARVVYRKKRLEGILEEAIANGSDSIYRFADRLLSSYEKLFLFTRYKDVEATNNAAERSLRHIVLWRKTSYGTQSEEGSHFLERAVSIWMTLKKQNREILSFLEQAYLSSIDPRISVPAI